MADSLMTQDQVLGQVRQILPAIGWVLIFTGKISPETWGAFMAVAPQALGAAFILGSAGWALVANTRNSIMKSVAKMPETEVKSDGNGHAIITVHDKELSTTAKEAATPQTNGKNSP